MIRRTRNARSDFGARLALRAVLARRTFASRSTLRALIALRTQRAAVGARQPLPTLRAGPSRKFLRAGRTRRPSQFLCSGRPRRPDATTRVGLALRTRRTITARHAATVTRRAHGSRVQYGAAGRDKPDEIPASIRLRGVLLAWSGGRAPASRRAHVIPLGRWAAGPLGRWADYTNCMRMHAHTWNLTNGERKSVISGNEKCNALGVSHPVPRCDGPPEAPML